MNTSPAAKTWLAALKAYCYPVELSKYEKAAEFPQFFKKNISGYRAATIGFEDYFRARAPNSIEVWYEVVFWKFFSQGARRQGGTNRVVDCIQARRITASSLWEGVQNFITRRDEPNLEVIRELLGMKTKVLAVPLTFVAFAMPDQFPMIDKKVAYWVNGNMQAHKVNRVHKLTCFKMNYTSLQDNDFESYLRWVEWCREVASVLSELTRELWRARDVEMAVFTAYDKKLSLSVLP